MGSGKGKTRRAQAIKFDDLDAVAEATSDRNKWSKFVEAGHLKGVKIYQYYLGDASRKAYSDVAREKLTRELFIDAVAVGALTLPAKYSAEDFAFRASGQRITISLKNRPDLEGGSNFVFCPLARSHTMAHEDVCWFLDRIPMTINSILRADV